MLLVFSFSLFVVVVVVYMLMFVSWGLPWCCCHCCCCLLVGSHTLFFGRYLGFFFLLHILYCFWGILDIYKLDGMRYSVGGFWEQEKWGSKHVFLEIPIVRARPNVPFFSSPLFMYMCVCPPITHSNPNDLSSIVFI